MEHLRSGPLPGCDTLEQAEERYRLEAMQMELRERRVLHPEWHVSIKEVERHLDELREVDRNIYITYLYTMSMKGVIFSHLSDEQLRNALTGINLALHQLYTDHNIIRPAVTCYRRTNFQATDDMLKDVRDRVTAILPRMLSIVADHATKDVAAVPRMPVTEIDADTDELVIAEGAYFGGTAAESSLPASNAEAALRLHVLVFQRHPIDLLREISNWLTDMENSE